MVRVPFLCFKNSRNMLSSVSHYRNVFMWPMKTKLHWKSNCWIFRHIFFSSSVSQPFSVYFCLFKYEVRLSNLYIHYPQLNEAYITLTHYIRAYDSHKSSFKVLNWRIWETKRQTKREYTQERRMKKEKEKKNSFFSFDCLVFV